MSFYWAIINRNFIWNINLNTDFCCDLRNKSACLNTILYAFTLTVWFTLYPVLVLRDSIEVSLNYTLYLILVANETIMHQPKVMHYIARMYTLYLFQSSFVTLSRIKIPIVFIPKSQCIYMFKAVSFCERYSML